MVRIVLKKKNIILIFLLLVVFLGIFVFLRINKKGQTQTPIPSKPNLEQAKYKSITPGKTKKDEVLSSMGKPLKESNNILEFESTNPNWNNEITLTDNQVSFIKEVVTPFDNKTANDITRTYGPAKNMLYPSGANIGMVLYVYPEYGIAYLGYEQSKIILEVWYFTPTTFDEFKKEHSQGYFETPSPQQ